MTRRLAAFALIAALAAPLAANAQDYGRHDGHGGNNGYRGGYAGAPQGDRGGGEYRGGPPAREGPGAGGFGSRSGPGAGGFGSRVGPGAGGFGSRVDPGYRMHGLARGEYWPPEARGPVVQDFERYHLRRPPRGYFWYRAGDDFVLAGVSSGVIFEVIPADPF